MVLCLAACAVAEMPQKDAKTRGLLADLWCLKKMMVARMRGIVKMGQDVFQVAFYETQQKHAHLTFKTLRVLEKARFAVWRGALKIRVSVVRFRPRPPIQDAQLFSVGRFHLGHPQSTRDAAQFYVCQPPPVLGAVMTPKSHIPPSLLTKLLQILTLWHTQNAFHGNNLRVCRIRGFAIDLLRQTMWFVCCRTWCSERLCESPFKYHLPWQF